MIEWLWMLIEWIHFVLRHDRNVQLGQHVDRVLYTKPRTPRTVRWARWYITKMDDPEYRHRHIETLVRAGH